MDFELKGVLKFKGLGLNWRTQEGSSTRDSDWAELWHLEVGSDLDLGTRDWAGH